MCVDVTELEERSCGCFKLSVTQMSEDLTFRQTLPLLFYFSQSENSVLKK